MHTAGSSNAGLVSVPEPMPQNPELLLLTLAPSRQTEAAQQPTVTAYETFSPAIEQSFPAEIRTRALQMWQSSWSDLFKLRWSWLRSMYFSSQTLWRLCIISVSRMPTSRTSSAAWNAIAEGHVGTHCVVHRAAAWACSARHRSSDCKFRWITNYAGVWCKCAVIIFYGYVKTKPVLARRSRSHQ